MKPIELKATYWAEMAILINNEFQPAPEGFGYIVTNEKLIAGYISDYDTDRGDSITPAGSVAIHTTINLKLTENTTAKDVYEFLRDAVNEASEVALKFD